MSHVHLCSLERLERLAARRTFPDLHRRSGVCRNLFGAPDHEELSRDVQTKLREISDRDQRRWNFNFETDTPLDGNYHWEGVSTDATPGFYHDSPRVPALSPGPESSSTSTGTTGTPCPAEVNQENRADRLNSGKKTSRKRVPCKRPVESESNTHITDFFVKRKRAADIKSNDTSPKSPIPVEQTPRKRIR